MVRTPTSRVRHGNKRRRRKGHRRKHRNNQVVSRPHRTLQVRERPLNLTGGTLRADGTMRPVLKVREGYVPPDEQQPYVIPQKVSSLDIMT